MRIGYLDTKVTIQRKTVTQTEAGDEVEAWSTLAENRWASIEPLRGSERFAGEQIQSSEQVEFRIRWSVDVATLSPLDRIVLPVAAATDSPGLQSTIYDVLAVGEIDRRKEFRVIAARRPDVST
jgi:head-tail adaptor